MTARSFLIRQQCKRNSIVVNTYAFCLKRIRQLAINSKARSNDQSLGSSSPKVRLKPLPSDVSSVYVNVHFIPSRDIQSLVRFGSRRKANVG